MKNIFSRSKKDSDREEIPSSKKINVDFLSYFVHTLFYSLFCILYCLKNPYKSIKSDAFIFCSLLTLVLFFIWPVLPFKFDMLDLEQISKIKIM